MSKRYDRLDLDTAATIFPLGFNKQHRALIRLTITMSENIDKALLQLALNRLFPRFPSFYVRLNYDFLHYFFEKLDCPPIIQEESEADKPLSMSLKELKKCAFKITTKENLISLEYFHAVSDGYGGSVFLKSLIAEYLHIRYEITIPKATDILSVQETGIYDEVKNSYRDITGNFMKTKKMPKPYILKGSIDKNIHITELSFKTDDLLKCANKYGVTLTAFLSAIFTAAIFDLQQSKKRKYKEIRLSIPIDLRKRFKSKSLRNFSLIITLRAGKLANEIPFSSLCHLFDDQLKRDANKNKLSAMASAYVKMTKNKFISFSPLFLKKWVVQILFLTSLSDTSITFSNLGIWKLPDNIQPYIQNLSFIFSPKPKSPYSCGLVSLGNTLTLTLTRNISEALLESRVLHLIEKEILT